MNSNMVIFVGPEIATGKKNSQLINLYIPRTFFGDLLFFQKIFVGVPSMFCEDGSFFFTCSNFGTYENDHIIVYLLMWNCKMFPKIINTASPSF